jgi:hypothetical protein
MGAGLLAVKSGFILFIKNYQFPIQINTLEREREREAALGIVEIGTRPENRTSSRLFRWGLMIQGTE